MGTHISGDYRPSEDDPYMNPEQLEYFRIKLLRWRNQLLKELNEILDHLKENLKEPETLDQGIVETDTAFKIKTSNRYRKLINKINDALERIEDGTYGYCEETGKEIGIKRLEVRPIATLCIEAQEKHERIERRNRAGYRI